MLWTLEKFHKSVKQKRNERNRVEKNGVSVTIITNMGVATQTVEMTFSHHAQTPGMQGIVLMKLMTDVFSWSGPDGKNARE